jgi:hypothetical protein
MLKPGYKTTEFAVAVATIIGTVLFSVADKLPPRYAAMASAVAAGSYAVSRGLAKVTPPKDSP